MGSVLLVKAHASYLIWTQHLTVEKGSAVVYCCPVGSFVVNWTISKTFPFTYVRAAHSLLTSISLLTSDMGRADC